MKNAYRRIVLLLENLILKIHIFKTWIFEWFSIIKKSNQYKNVVWSSEQQNEFDEFWTQNYGRKISNRWHRLYQSANGVFNISYFPEILYTTKLEPKLNSLQWCKAMSDKSLVELLYSKDAKIKFPRTIVLNCSGIYYDENRKIISKEDAMQLLNDSGDIVIKPIIGESSGRGVLVLNIEEGRDTETYENIETIINKYKKNYIVQERLRQNTQYAALYKNSINTIRITTYIINDKVNHVPISLRVGSNGQKVDNIHAGGIGIGVSDNGELNSIGFDNDNNKVYKHPNTGIVFEGYNVPYVKEIINISHSLHGLTPHVGIISWDFMVNDNNDVVLIEANHIGQGIWFPQIIHGSTAFGKNTKDVLQLIR